MILLLKIYSKMQSWKIQSDQAGVLLGTIVQAGTINHALHEVDQLTKYPGNIPLLHRHTHLQARYCAISHGSKNIFFPVLSLATPVVFRPTISMLLWSFIRRVQEYLADSIVSLIPQLFKLSKRVVRAVPVCGASVYKGDWSLVEARALGFRPCST